MQFHAMSFTHQFEILMLINKNPNFITVNSVQKYFCEQIWSFLFLDTNIIWIESLPSFAAAVHENLELLNNLGWSGTVRTFSSLGHAIINIKYPVGLALVEKLIGILISIIFICGKKQPAIFISRCLVHSCILLHFTALYSRAKDFVMLI